MGQGEAGVAGVRRCGILVGCRIRGGNFSTRSTTDVCLRSELQRKLRGLAAAGGEKSFASHLFNPVENGSAF